MTEFITTNWVSLAGAIIGLLYLYLEYKANILMWIASIVMALFFIYIFHHTQLYASMVIYIYFLGASVYGWITWLKNHEQQDSETVTKRAPRNVIRPVLLYTTTSFLLILTLLHFLAPDSLSINIKLGDALTTALNVVALWMTSRKWAEQWLLIIPANLLSSVLLFVQGDILSASLFFIYFIVSIAGYFNWCRLARKKHK